MSLEVLENVSGKIRGRQQPAPRAPEAIVPVPPSTGSSEAVASAPILILLRPKTPANSVGVATKVLTRALGIRVAGSTSMLTTRLSFIDCASSLPPGGPLNLKRRGSFRAP